MRRSIVLIFLFCAPILGQSRRVDPAAVKTLIDTTAAETSSARSVKEMFDEANAYNRNKFSDFEQKKIPVSDGLIAQTQRERKQLAAKYAAIVSKRTDLMADETYYLGMLHWIADNLDATRETFARYLEMNAPVAEKAQDVRAIMAVIYARQRQFSEAEKMSAEYSRNSPVRLSQRGQIEREIAHGLAAQNNYEAAAPHAEGSYGAYKTVAGDPASREKILNDLIDSGLFLFKTYSRLDRRSKAEAALDDMRKTALDLQAGTLWYYAVDSQIKYQIETGRKPQALENYLISLIQAGKDFTEKTVQTDLQQRLKKRAKQYKLLGESTPELAEIDRSFPGEKRAIADFRGKVVLLDFWATWCVPCIDAFPTMLEWKQDFGPEGFVILGITRYYGYAGGFAVDNPTEIDFLKRFTLNHGLTYDFLVAKDETNHRTFGAATIPTSVLIDRKGVVRYVESGTSPYRLDEMREMIVKLLAEK